MRTWCATRTRFRTAGETRSGERRTVALPSGSLSYPTNAAFGDALVAFVVDIVKLAAEFLDVRIQRGKIRSIVARVERRFFLAQLSKVADRHPATEYVVALHPKF